MIIILSLNLLLNILRILGNREISEICENLYFFDKINIFSLNFIFI